MVGIATLVPQMTERIATYTATDIVTIIAAVGVLMGSLVTGVVTVIGTLRNGQKTDQLVTVIAGAPDKPGLTGKLDEIHTLTNSTMTAVRAELATSQALNAELRTAVQDLKTERDKLAAVVATATLAAEKR